MKNVSFILAFAVQFACAQSLAGGSSSSVFHEADSVMVSVPCADVKDHVRVGNILRCYPRGTVGWIVDGPASDSLGVVYWNVWWRDSLFTTNPQSWCKETDMVVTKAFPIVVDQLPTATFTVKPTSVSAGQGVVTFKWTTKNATSVGLEGWPGYQNLNDSEMVLITYSQTVTLTATNVYGMVQIPVTIPVITPPPPIPTTVAVGVRVVVIPVNGLNVRSMPSMVGNFPIWVEKKGQEGIVIAGATVASGFTWWTVQWDDKKSGWSADTYLMPIATPPPLPYPSIADKHDSLTFTTSGFDPIIIQCLYPRMGSADTSMTMEPFYYVRPKPLGLGFDTTYITATYRFTKPKNSVER